MTDQAGGGQDEHNADRNQDESRGSAPSRSSAGGGSSRSSGRQAPKSRAGQSPDVLTEFQRWLIRSSARNMRKQVGSQVRRTLGGGRTESSDVWDTATTEIPPEVGESPECQWCPICRAARAARASNTDFGGHLSTAGDVVASAVQEAMRAFDSVLPRAGRGQTRSQAGNGWAADGNGDWSSGRDSWAAAHGGQPGSFDEPAGPGQEEAPAGDHRDEPEGSDEPHDRG